MGTPHRGSDVAAAPAGRILRGVANALTIGAVRRDLYKFIYPNSDELQDIGDRFKFHASKLQIVSMYEQKKTGSIVVGIRSHSIYYFY